MPATMTLGTGTKKTARPLSGRAASRCSDAAWGSVDAGRLLRGCVRSVVDRGRIVDRSGVQRGIVDRRRVRVFAVQGDIVGDDRTIVDGGCVMLAGSEAERGDSDHRNENELLHGQ